MDGLGPGHSPSLKRAQDGLDRRFLGGSCPPATAVTHAWGQPVVNVWEVGCMCIFLGSLSTGIIPYCKELKKLNTLRTLDQAAPAFTLRRSYSRTSRQRPSAIMPSRSRTPTRRKPWRSCNAIEPLFSGKMPASSVQKPACSEASMSLASRPACRPRHACARNRHRRSPRQRPYIPHGRMSC